MEVVYDSNLTLERLPEVCRTYTIEKAIVATVIDLSRDCLLYTSITLAMRSLENKRIRSSSKDTKNTEEPGSP